MKALITVVCSLAVGLSYGAKISFGDDGFGGDRDYNKTILRANSGTSCTDNEYDKGQYCKCNPGERISGFKSVHSNHHEDRIWTLKCSPIPGNPPQQKIMPGYGKSFESPFGSATKDMEFDVEKVLPLDQAGQRCWGKGLNTAEGYNYEGCQATPGKCNYCGKDGMCCREGKEGEGEGDCLKDSANFNHHGCVAKTGSGINNSGLDCQENCKDSNNFPGRCRWCGSKGVCCKKGEVGNECDGEIGGKGYYGCVAESESYVGFIVGMQSFHFRDGSNGIIRIEDRIYSFYWQHIPDWKLVDCEYLQENQYDGLLDIVLIGNQVIAGVKSTYDMTRHDRKFRVKVCSLEPRCGQLSSIKYFPEQASLPVTSLVVAGYMSKNNIRHSEAGQFTAKLSDNLASKVAREYSFTRIEGDTMTASLEVSAGVNWGIGMGEISASITAGFETTWSTSETWSRSNREEITEESGKELSWTNTCPAHKFCESTITMSHGEIEIPYEIKAYTKGEIDDTCSETGVVTVSNFFKANEVPSSYFRCDCKNEGTERKPDGNFDCSSNTGKCKCKAGWTTYDCGISDPDYNPDPVDSCELECNGQPCNSDNTACDCQNGSSQSDCSADPCELECNGQPCNSDNTACDCQNGSSQSDCTGEGAVQLKNGKFPEVFLNGIWSPICGHWFWNTNFGANLFCQELTSNPASTGQVIRRKDIPLKKDAIRIGRCESNDQWLSCTGGCNDLGTGKGCADCRKGISASIEIKCN